MTIDREIAEKVMGWTETGIGEDGVGYWADDYGHQYWISPLDAECEHCEVWHPSTDIAQAFEVVEKLKQRGISFRLVSTAIQNAAGEWGAQFSKVPHISSGFRVEGWAETPALAICKAALEVVG